MLRFWKLADKHLNLEMSSGGSLRVRILERPGLWMTPAELDRLVGDLRGIASRVVSVGELDYGVLTGEQDRLANSIVTLVSDRRSGAPVAFNALAILPVRLRGRETEVLHLGLVMVDPSFRSRGMSWILYGLTCMLLFFRNQLRPLWISNVTQVPAIVGMVSESFARVFPAPQEDSRRSHDHRVLARDIMRHHRHAFGVGEDAEFDAEASVIRNAYTGGSDHLKKTFDEAAKHRDELYNRLCRETLDYDRGDDFLQLGQVDLGVLRRYLLRSVPRRFLPGVLAQLVVVGLGSVVLPVVHWLTPSRQMGELRPWRR